MLPRPQRITKAEALQTVAKDQPLIELEALGCGVCAQVKFSRERGYFLAENGAALATLDRFAARPGHIVIALKQHIEAVADVPWEQYQATQRLAWEASIALERCIQPSRVYVASLGAKQAISTSFPHHHVHVVPLQDGGDQDRPANVLTWTQGVYVYDRSAADEWIKALTAAWP